MIQRTPHQAVVIQYIAHTLIAEIQHDIVRAELKEAPIITEAFLFRVMTNLNHNYLGITIDSSCLTHLYIVIFCMQK